MPKFVLIFHGGASPGNIEESEALVAAWAEWMQGVGPSLIDPGNPAGETKTVHADGSIADDAGPNPATGYTIVEADTMADAVALTEGNPIFNAGGSIEIFEAV